MSVWFLKLAKPFSKLLGNLLTFGVGGEASGELVDIALKPSIEKAEEKRVRKQLESVGKQYVRQLTRELEEFAKASHLNADAVAIRIEAVLSQFLNAEFFVQNDLDAAKIEAAIQAESPLTVGHFSESETALYSRTLHLAIVNLVEISHKLKGFGSKSAGEQLARLRQIAAKLLNMSRDVVAGREHAAAAEKGIAEVHDRLSVVGSGVEQTQREVSRAADELKHFRELFTVAALRQRVGAAGFAEERGMTRNIEGPLRKDWMN